MEERTPKVCNLRLEPPGPELKLESGGAAVAREEREDDPLQSVSQY